ncbi:hypothetical protein LPJ78_003675 [Coemansia sp. RSA 989]|nr:hypothetical protein LPJ68_002762 [Coemansia sp. RSA 1086]KAJ1749774.1 hypothetical protein LPJ79_003455 [Coemansia sp. RSA 1821]KAJ1863999.1 hypothetical protein LPJ78_003675 [Coemansia sp. RSA 989]KAJ1871718.1 hypothetical protein LPJ55_003666 [Coemansia sp. RSA 990]KAJ2629481.1 hypothetical protein H4R22_003291 [Coemansia sp. RSA 1290]KAJ2648207.1 hypothetical protein IWW40_004078 [Coemansia sp. RSA 1250]KAJ2670181.1 hypothetical protein IWW42_004139 [Coemansia sp. RSA 1085]
MAKTKWPDFEATVSYEPFQLDSGLGKGLDKQQVYLKKFGDRATAIHERLAETGKEEGIEFSFGGKMSNTLDSHRLIDYAKLHGLEGTQHKVIQSLFRRYFEQEQDIGDHSVLLDAAEEAGLDREQIRDYLQSTDGLDALQTKMEQFKKLGVSGVPFYIINNRFGISGAESSQAFVDAFDKVFSD